MEPGIKKDAHNDNRGNRVDIYSPRETCAEGREDQGQNDDEICNGFQPEEAPLGIYKGWGVPHRNPVITEREITIYGNHYDDNDNTGLDPSAPERRWKKDLLRGGNDKNDKGYEHHTAGNDPRNVFVFTHPVILDPGIAPCNPEWDQLCNENGDGLIDRL
ncbi:MAG: hypothetical protein NTZ39_01080 [Methanoregula sp.]|nr:hypothetical protein [Methanoregula sp.]